jgi:hypothetical protein
MLGWSRARLADLTHQKLTEVAAFEDQGRDIPPDVIVIFRKILEAACVEFTDGDVPSVRLRQGGEGGQSP